VRGLYPLNFGGVGRVIENFDIKHEKNLFAKCNGAFHFFHANKCSRSFGGYPKMKKKGETKPKAAPKPAEKPAADKAGAAKKGGKK
jgi:hypothetical protein